MPPEPARRRGDLPLLLGVGLAAVAIQLPIFDRWLALLDEGYILALADEINRGKVLYRDIYVDAPFPGAFHLLAAWFRLTGPSIWASRLLVVAAFALFAVLVVRLGRALVPRAWAAALGVLVLCYRVWAFPHWHIFSYSLIAATLLTAAVALVAAALRTRAAAPLVAAGALAGAGIMCKQDYGLGVTGAVGLFLLVAPLLDRDRPSFPRSLAPALGFAAGAALVVAPALAYFAARGALGELVLQAVVRPLGAAVAYQGYTRLPPLWPLAGQDPVLREQIGAYFPSILLTLRWNQIAYGWLYRETAVWDLGLKVLFYAPLVLFVTAAVFWGRAAAVRGWRGTAGAEDERRLLVLAWAGGFLLAFNPPRDWVHLMMIYPPALVLAVALFEQGRRGERPRVPFSLVAWAGIGLAAVAAASLWLAVELGRQLDTPLATARGGVATDAEQARILDDVLGYIARTAPPGDPVPVYPTQPMITFLAGRETVAGFHVIWPVQDPRRDEKIIAELERRRLGSIIYSLSQYAHIGNFRDNAPRLFDYLVHHYEIAEVFSRQPFGQLLTALRRVTPGPGLGAPLDLAASDAVTRRLWPFAEVLASRVGTAESRLVARVTTTIPPRRPRLAFRYGVNPERWLEQTSGPFTFLVEVEDPARGGPAPLYSGEIDPARRLRDRRWQEESLDLSSWAAREVTLAFSVTAPREPKQPTDIAGWAAPRILGD